MVDGKGYLPCQDCHFYYEQQNLAILILWKK